MPDNPPHAKTQVSAAQYPVIRRPRLSRRRFVAHLGDRADIGARVRVAVRLGAAPGSPYGSGHWPEIPRSIQDVGRPSPPGDPGQAADTVKAMTPPRPESVIAKRLVSP
ncbi:hypothetical protein ACGFNP_29670 [Nonomuraea sp. NPDC049269]|uniref:hypothetical protein n=1 Tax=Nonomuraea sp. NPDC049269 TaxID=3364349 RepID=UPI00371ADBAC